MTRPSRRSLLRPGRRLVFPFSVAFFPMIWFVFREVPVRVVDGRRVATPLSRTLALAAIAFLASYVVALAAAAAIGPRRLEDAPWRRLLLSPSNRTLLVLVALWSIVAGSVALASTADLPFWSELVIGVPLLWPLLISVLATFAAGNALPALQDVAVQAGLAVVGLACSAAWLFLLSTGIARAMPTE